MSRPMKVLLALLLAAGFAAVSTSSQAESSAKKGVQKVAEQSKAASDDFEENRKAHMQKSKENNANKGAN